VVRLWEAPTGRLRSKLTGHNNALYTLAFNPAGITLASGGEDESVRMWESATGQPLGQPLKGHSSAVMALAFSPDGTLLGSASADQSVRLWTISAESLLGQAWRLLRRDLSMVEWTELTGTPERYQPVFRNYSNEGTV
jgi:WD40 repeat protein